MDDLVPISTKLDTVIEDTTTLKTTTGTIDTTTKDTNSKVNSMQTKVDGIDSNVAEIKSTVSNLGGETSTTGWGVLAKEKTFTGQYAGLIEVERDALESFVFLDYFIPPVSGMYTIEVQGNLTVNDWIDMGLYMFTYNDLARIWQTGVIMNEMNNKGTMTGSFWNLKMLLSDLKDNNAAQYEFMKNFTIEKDTEVLEFGNFYSYSETAIDTYDCILLEAGKPYILTGYLDDNQGGDPIECYISSVKYYYGNDVNPHL